MKAKYYRINLNKSSNRLDQFEQQKRRRRILTIASFFILLLAAVGAIVYKTQQTNKIIESKRAELKDIEDRIAQLTASSDFLSPEDIFLLSQVTQNRMLWSDKIAILGNILPEDVVITQLVLDRGLNAFVIKGVSKVKAGMQDLDLVMSIIDILKSQPDFTPNFSEIKFQMSQRIKHQEQEMVKFEIACLLKA